MRSLALGWVIRLVCPRPIHRRQGRLMPRGPKPAKSKRAKPPVGRKSPENDARVRDLEERLAKAVRDKAEALKLQAEALEQQAATSEILRVLSRSHSTVEPVFKSIASSAAQLCAASVATVTLLDGDTLRQGALTIAADEWAPFRQMFPRPLAGAGVQQLVVRERVTINITDLETDSRIADYSRPFYRKFRLRSGLWVPMLRDTEVIGIVIVWHTEPSAFGPRHEELLKTFADQAVIAIENVRLFNETKEALDRQTATSEILRVISSSPTDVQPVFDAIVQSARRLLSGHGSALTRVAGNMLHLQAFITGTQGDDAARAVFPIALSSNKSVHSRAVRARAPAIITDIETDPMFETDMRAMARKRGYRSVMAVPLLREGEPIGAISVTRPEAGSFTDKQIALLQTFADQAVIALEHVRLVTELQETNRDLTEALEQQTATSDVLRVISQSQTDLQPVFDALIDSATKLCVADIGAITRFDGKVLRFVNHSGMSAEVRAFWQQNPSHLGRGSVTGRAALERRTIHVPDVLADSSYDYTSVASPLREGQAITGYRAALVAPMLRDGALIGTIQMMRREARPFTASQIKLLETFADQAVIAIENVRLFNETKEALEQQTATSEILRVISRSPTDVQPVFDAIAQSAVRLCDAVFGAVFRLEGGLIQVGALTGIGPEGAAILSRMFPIPHDATGDSTVARAIVERGVVHVIDTEAPQAPRMAREGGRAIGFRSQLTVPMLRAGEPIGAVNVSRREPGPFSEVQIELLKTFADQAVIAIENVRLFSDLQASNRDLTRALEQQTSTSEILRVISRSPTTVEPVFQSIVANGRRVCQAHQCLLVGFDGEMLTWLASDNFSPAREEALRSIFPYRPTRAGTTGRVVLDRDVVHIPDVMEDADHAHKDVSMKAGARAQLAVPLFRENEVIGALHVARPDPGPFSEDQIALLKTFADQAVIAIENFRLFKELEARTQALTRSVDELTALGEVNRALSSTLDVDVVLNTIVTRANDLIGADGCTIFEYDEAAEQFHLRATRNLEPRLVELARGTPLRRGDQGILGRLPSERQPVQVPDISGGSYSSPISAALIDAGYRAVVAVPLIREDHLIGALAMNRKTPGEFSPETIELLQTFATQSALAIQNARLFREIEDKSRQLEVASQHKSEFLANMSHELRTPLNAIIGFSEVLTDRMFGELNEKQEEYLKDIYASGTHLLSLINDILDLSKIEAGRMELELSDFDLPAAIENALMLIRERAGRRSITLQMNVDSRLGQIKADERKVRQVVLNLLSNAIKFTPEGGRIEVGATPKDGLVEVSVSDTGVGIAPGDQEAVFEEFRQVGTADKKVEGTGLGLTLCRKFVELHGGRIWVKSQVGVGSTFTFTVPVRSA